MEGLLEFLFFASLLLRNYISRFIDTFMEEIAVNGKKQGIDEAKAVIEILRRNLKMLNSDIAKFDRTTKLLTNHLEAMQVTKLLNGFCSRLIHTFL